MAKRKKKVLTPPCHTQTCDRCKYLCHSTMMSMYNIEMCCPKCIDKEKSRDDYKIARDTELEEIQKGNYNFPGIGLT